MHEKLFEVEDNFYFSGRQGTIVVGRITKSASLFDSGDEVILIQPSGKEIRTKIDGIEMTKPSNPELIGVWFKTLAKEDIPIGTKVFLKM